VNAGWMSDGAADIIGLIGSALMVIAYAYSNIARQMSKMWFNMLNLVGSLMLMASLTIHYNMASMVLEIVWAAIAVMGLIKAYTERRVA
jgi:hypothetical protein